MAENFLPRMKLRGLSDLGGLGDGLASGNSVCFICYRLVAFAYLVCFINFSVIYAGFFLFGSVKEQNLLDRCLNPVQ